MSDSIYRQDAIDAFGLSEKTRKYGGDHSGYNTMMLYEIQDVLESLPSADRPKNMIHIDEVYRLIAGHSDYHGDSILSAFTCLVEGKDVKPITPLNESADRPTGKWIEVKDWDGEIHYQCDQCKSEYILIDGTPQDNDYIHCPHCGARLGGDTE